MVKMGQTVLMTINSYNKQNIEDAYSECKEKMEVLGAGRSVRIVKFEAHLNNRYMTYPSYTATMTVDMYVKGQDFEPSVNSDWQEPNLMEMQKTDYPHQPKIDLGPGKK